MFAIDIPSAKESFEPYGFEVTFTTGEMYELVAIGADIITPSLEHGYTDQAQHLTLEGLAPNDGGFNDNTYIYHAVIEASPEASDDDGNGDATVDIWIPDQFHSKTVEIGSIEILLTEEGDSTL